MADSVFQRLTNFFGETASDGEQDISAFPINATLVPGVKSWSHPLKQRGYTNILHQLAHQAKANAGYFPLGASGLWHGGVHFDGGTAGVLDQGDVLCVADGQVVAYLIDKESAKTDFIVNKVAASKSFSRSFVLVQHRLEAPSITGRAELPPSLIFYSLYMHLQDGSIYRNNPYLDRPVFWQDKGEYVVSLSAKDKSTKDPAVLGANVRNQVSKGVVIGHLPQGSRMQISGEGEYRRLENTLGPAALLDGGSLRGYIRFDRLDPLDDGVFHAKDNLIVYSKPDRKSRQESFTLPIGTEIKISGDGALRKLESVAQFVYFDSLKSLVEPHKYNEIVVLEKPFPIKAGGLIGRVGKYQDRSAVEPEERLHLEIFAGEDAEDFIDSCREWSKGYSQDQRSWLKLRKGTMVVAHREDFSKSTPPIEASEHPVSGSDLLLPKSLLDGLRPEHKITATSAEGRNACNWYYLEDVFSDASNKLLKGWVMEEVGVTPWVSPWEWDGYEVITDYTTPAELMAASLRSEKRLTEKQLKRFGAAADEGEKSEVKVRLRQLVDRDDNGKVTANELRSALQTPSGAQKLSKLVVNYESEWRYTAHKWDALDELFGCSESTPNVNWLAEKRRIRSLSWWDEVAKKLWLPEDGRVYHFNPMGLLLNIGLIDDNDLRWLIVPQGQFTFDAEGNDIEGDLHFTRVAHAPPGASGITIGRGYDLGQRPNPEKDLSLAGVGEPLFSWLIKAKHLRGDAARAYYRTAPQNVREYVITRKQQFELFVRVYEDLKNNVIDISRRQKGYAPLDWDSLDSRVQDVVVDLRYRGDYHDKTRSFVQKPFVENDVSALRSALENKENWPGVPDDRYRRRAGFLR